MMIAKKVTTQSGEWTGAGFGHRRGLASLLAFHGFSGAGADFEILASKLTTPLGLVAPNLPGHGSGLSVQSGGAQECIRALGHLADAWVQTPAVVMGYSMGARLALHFALAFPQKVCGLILIGATAGLENEEDRQARRNSDEELANWILAHGVDAFCKRWMSHPLIATQNSIPKPYFEKMQVRKRELSSVGLAWALRTLGPGSIRSVWNRLDEIKVPVLVMVGEKDSKYIEIGHRMSALLSTARMAVVPGAGHAAHLEASDKTAFVMDQYLGELGLV